MQQRARLHAVQPAALRLRARELDGAGGEAAALVARRPPSSRRSRCAAPPSHVVQVHPADDVVAVGEHPRRHQPVADRGELAGDAAAWPSSV